MSARSPATRASVLLARYLAQLASGPYGDERALLALKSETFSAMAEAFEADGVPDDAALARRIAETARSRAVSEGRP